MYTFTFALDYRSKYINFFFFSFCVDCGSCSGCVYLYIFYILFLFSVYVFSIANATAHGSASLLTDGDTFFFLCSFFTNAACCLPNRIFPKLK